MIIDFSSKFRLLNIFNHSNIFFLQSLNDVSILIDFENGTEIETFFLRSAFYSYEV